MAWYQCDTTQSNAMCCGNTSAQRDERRDRNFCNHLTSAARLHPANRLQNLRTHTAHRASAALSQLANRLQPPIWPAHDREISVRCAQGMRYACGRAAAFLSQDMHDSRRIRLLRLGRWLTILGTQMGLPCSALICLAAAVATALATATDRLKIHLCSTAAAAL
jgi:hypothetical protein